MHYAKQNLLTSTEFVSEGTWTPEFRGSKLTSLKGWSHFIFFFLNSYLIPCYWKTLLLAWAAWCWRVIFVPECIRIKQWNCDMLRNWNFCETRLTKFIHTLEWGFSTSALLTFGLVKCLLWRLSCSVECLSPWPLPTTCQQYPPDTPCPQILWQLRMSPDVVQWPWDRAVSIENHHFGRKP